MTTEERWYQKFRCRNCGKIFSQFPALLGCARGWAIRLLESPHRLMYDSSINLEIVPAEVRESLDWVRTHSPHRCSETEEGMADLIGFTTEAPQMKEGEIRELLGDEIPEHLR